MRIRVLGCHGSDLRLRTSMGVREHRSCGFLLNDTVLLDAGTVAGILSLSEQQQIRSVILSHAHFDHIQGLPALADNLVGGETEPIILWGTAEVLQCIKQYIFNDQIFPDFFALPDPRRPVFTQNVMSVGMMTSVSEFNVMAVEVNHLVPAVGFLIREGDASFLFSGDTYCTNHIWALAAREPTLKAAFLEASFPDDMEELALASKHLTPALLYQEFQKIGRPDLPVYVYHLKPRFRERIIEQLAKLQIRDLTVLEEGQEIII